jgi:hypothetical protein
MEATTSWNPQGLSRPVMGLLYLFFTFLPPATFDAILFEKLKLAENPVTM